MAVLLDRKPEQPPQQYPLMTVAVVQQGLLVTIMRSAVEKNETLLPMENIAALLPDILAALPRDAVYQVMQTFKEKQKGRDLVQAAMQHPTLLRKVD